MNFPALNLDQTRQLLEQDGVENETAFHLAMVARGGLGTLAQVIHPYPTQADALRRAAFQYSVTRITPVVKRLLALWFRLT